MRPNLNVWREAASLILAAKSPFSQSSSSNYKILAMKRSSKMKFMPETYVFTGGALSKNDSDEKWWQLYEKFGFRKESFDDLKPAQNIPTILESDETNRLPKYLSLRICAIRETFEECGILLCKSPKIDHDINSKWTSFVGGQEFIKWQNKVHDDASEFLNLCTDLDLYPDVWGLKIWSNWLTPPALPLRFNTIFFLASLNQMPSVNKNTKEVQDLMWATPEEYIALNDKETVLIPPPQTYEISRLRIVPDIENLAKFADERAKYGCETYWPYRIQDKHGLYSVLPGDDLYPAEIDKDNTDVPQVAELPDSRTKNRVFHKTDYLNAIKIQNFTPKCNHLTPHPRDLK